VPRAPGRSRRERWFFYFFEKILCRGSGAEAVGKDGFSIFLKKSYAEGPVQRPSAKTVFYFLKKFLCRVLLATMLGKAGNTRARKILPRVAERSCQKPSAKVLC
jgi:hypothetical protein